MGLPLAQVLVCVAVLGSSARAMDEEMQSHAYVMEHEEKEQEMKSDEAEDEMNFDVHMGKDPREFAKHHEIAVPEEVEAMALLDDHRRDGYTGTRRLRLQAFGQSWTLDLLANSVCGSNPVHHHTTNGEDFVERKKLTSDCHYHGVVSSHGDHTWVVASTCHGLIATFWDGNDTYAVQPLQMKLFGKHVVYRQSDIIRVKKGGHCGTNHSHDVPGDHGDHHPGGYGDLDSMAASILGEEMHSRMKRQTMLRTGRRRIVDFLVVGDNRFYRMFTNEALIQNSIEMAVNTMDMAYRTINFRVILTGTIVFETSDPFFISTDSGTTISNFGDYIKRIQPTSGIRFDSAQLLSGIDFDRGVLGRGNIGQICLSEAVSIVQQVAGETLDYTAFIMSHELGHVMNFLHDRGRTCYNCGTDAPCVMWPFVGSRRTHLFSQCSLVDFAELSDSQTSCLEFEAECGNGFVDEGEECDCGHPDYESCNNSCCVQATCRLAAGAECAAGECCDTNDCTLMARDTTCRAMSNGDRCDLEDACDGVSGQCPDTKVRNGLPCRGQNENNCWDGTCISRLDQCQTLFGIRGLAGDDLCYTNNVNGSQLGHCGVSANTSEFFVSYEYEPCADEDVLCGKLWCDRTSYFYSANLPYSHIVEQITVGLTNNRRTATCWGATVRQASYYTSMDTDPFTTVANGQSCGSSKVCVNQRCLDIADTNITLCNSTNGQECDGNGVCNNFGNCHCNAGFSGDLCQTNIDDCVDVVCHNNGTCLDGANNFTCRCAANYTGPLCQEINHCSQNPCEGANSVCVSGAVGFVCACVVGYTGSPCMNIDECSTAAATSLPCSDNADCEDNDGGYLCMCRSGFEGDGRRCADVNECFVGDYELCPRESNCYNSFGSFTCTCRAGFLGNGTSCADVNECEADAERCLPFGACRNTYGSYVCDCAEGARHVWDRCEDVDECYAYPRVCDSRSNCTNSDLSYDCNGCRDGFAGSGAVNNCTDVDECQELEEDACTGNRSVCVNTYGSFYCVCLSGYEFNAAAGDCVDIDECVSYSRACFYDAQCVNTPGSFRCQCNEGFRSAGYGRYARCYDINECADSADDCDDDTRITCYNTFGSYRCDCSHGYMNTMVNASNDDADPTAAFNESDTAPPFMLSTRPPKGPVTSSALTGTAPLSPRTAKSHADPSPVTFTTAPPTVQTTQPPANYNDPEICVDEDECSMYGWCRPHGNCTNTVGSFVCDCEDGALQVGTFCYDIDECSNYNRDRYCDYNANCTNLSPGFSCDGCRPGYRGSGAIGTCRDVNECVEELDDCNVNGTGRCFNTAGSYLCLCNSGFYRLGDTCIDRDECQDYYYRLYYCSSFSTCENTFGSFTCTCNAGFTGSGRYCADVNECSLTDGNGEPTHGCEGSGVVCYNTPGSYRCQCGAGYSDADGSNFDNVTDCTDIDECGELSYCEPYGNCTNTDGSFLCNCSVGAELRYNRCQDINECDRYRHRNRYCDFNSNCDNAVLGFDCGGCRRGFYGDGTPGNCTDMDECETNATQCADRGFDLCVNTIGSFVCACNTGYVFNGTECVDRDECSLYSFCYRCSSAATCINTPGSFECVCRTGFQGDGYVCADLNECYTGGACNASNERCVNTYGSFRCLCSVGFAQQGGDSCEDVDECDAYGYCEPYGNCTNSIGSFSCQCAAGAVLSSGRCVDRDECEYYNSYLGLYCDRNALCVNTALGYRCDGCQAGFNGSGTPGDCADVNECLEGAHECNSTGLGRCLNTAGSFRCLCNSGFEYSYNSSECVDIDECSRYYCSYEATCKNSYGSFECTCKDGFAGSGRYCSDINECANETLPGCEGFGMECANTYGSYRCACGSGYTTFNSRCVDRDECVVYSACSPYGTCRNHDGGYNCTCRDGAVQAGRRCVDRDECSFTYRNQFCDRRAFCINTLLGYACDGCRVGFNGTGLPGNCTDFDECFGSSQGQGCNSTGVGRCVNTQGSFYCDCNYGFEYNGTHCNDRDECLYGYYCGYRETCTNSYGSYECKCRAGFRVRGSGTYCYDIDECSENATAPMANCTGDVNECSDNVTMVIEDCTGYGMGCINTAGSYRCGCLNGYRTIGTQCFDRDECAQYNACSPPNGTCTNTDGSYECQCPDGTQHSGFSCYDINECGYPYSYRNEFCDRNANCRNTYGGYSCDGCRSGFNGTGLPGNCTDFDECRGSSQGQNCYTAGLGRCINTQGSFYCNCDNGFVYNRSTGCVDRDECLYGYYCGYRETCTNSYGSYECKCRAGFRVRGSGTYCYDIDECSENATATMANCTGYGMGCINTAGSYRCGCLNGYRTIGTQCFDRDECAQYNACSPPNGTCTNTDGSYECQCPNGTQHSGFSCSDINECGYPYSYSNEFCDPNAACKNTYAGYSCDGCLTGYQGSGLPGNCSRIDYCAEGNHTCDLEVGYCSSTRYGAECECPYGYTFNDTCVDTNECLNDYFSERCSKNATCVNLPGSFECACDVGYQGNGFYCYDVDECARRTHNCSQEDNELVCFNTPGSFYCDCPVGYRMTRSDETRSMTCVEVNECVENNACAPYGNCTNTIGSFVCACAPGTEVQGFACLDRDECARRGEFCDRYANCTDTQFSYSCDGCVDGFLGDGRPGNCTDIHECNEGTDDCHDNATCVNYNGGFNCKCKPGFYGNGWIDCRDVNECSWYYRCRNGNCVNTIGSYICNCPIGYTFTEFDYGCTDVNECRGNASALPAACARDRMQCYNTPGSFECDCAPGYRRDIGNSSSNDNSSSEADDVAECVDMNECVEQSACRPYGNCTNTIGSYTCSCRDGAEQIGFRCLDRDECSGDNRQASTYCDARSECRNTLFSYQCLGCWSGYTGSGLPYDCYDINECRNETVDCSGYRQRCVNTGGSFHCTCESGYSMSYYSHECMDIDECGGNSPCNGGKCRNTVGSFVCDCAIGFYATRHGCADVDECRTGVHGCDAARNLTCHNTYGFFRCGCALGYSTTASGGCEDIDECGGTTCEPYGNCTNTVGSYVCACWPGAEQRGAKCLERNECIRYPNQDPFCFGRSCNNTVLGYSCGEGCAPGYTGDGNGGCEDIDECLNLVDSCNNNTDMACVNFNGNHGCSCRPGLRELYVRSIGRSICIDINECDFDNVCYNASATCVNLRGSWACNCSAEGYSGGLNETQCLGCPVGYRLGGPLGKDCLHVDECADGSHECNGSMCVNADPGYTCLCPDGFQDAGDNRSCVASTCRNLQGSCAPHGECIVADDGSYRCACVAGSEEVDLRCVDVNECGAATAPCHARATCRNAALSYSCSCASGFSAVGSAVVPANDSSLVCGDVDECAAGGTNSCDGNMAQCTNTEGSYTCECIGGFIGRGFVDTCLDVEECTTNVHSCNDLSRCTNTIGSYRCTCIDGFAQDLATGECSDLEECAAGAHGCPANTTVCLNTFGSYVCPCAPGYVNGSGSPTAVGCVDVDECESGAHDCGENSACVNTAGSYRCPCNAGFMRDGVAAAGCVDIEECLLDLHDCDVTSTFCNNTAPAFLCTCRPGYEVNPGSRRSCNDIDECSRRLRNCTGQNVVCSNVPGSSRCDCRTGFFRDVNGDCADVNALLNTSAFSVPMAPSPTTVTWEVKAFDDVRLTTYQILVVHLGVLTTQQAMELLRVAPDDLFPIGSSSIRTHTDLVDFAIVPGRPMAHIAAEVSVSMLESEQFTIGNDLPPPSGMIRNGPLSSNQMYTIFFRAFGNARRRRQANTGGTITRTSSFHPLQATEAMAPPAASQAPVTGAPAAGTDDGRTDTYWIIGAAVVGVLLILLILAVVFLIRMRGGTDRPDSGVNNGKSGMWAPAMSDTDIVMTNRASARQEEKTVATENPYTLDPMTATSGPTSEKSAASREEDLKATVVLNVAVVTANSDVPHTLPPTSDTFLAAEAPAPKPRGSPEQSADSSASKTLSEPSASPESESSVEEPREVTPLRQEPAKKDHITHL